MNEYNAQADVTKCWLDNLAIETITLMNLDDSIMYSVFILTDNNP